MSLYSLTEKTLQYFIVSIINSNIMSYYVDDFVNYIQTFQINNARQLLIVIPSKEKLLEFEMLFGNAIEIKKKKSSNQLSMNQSDSELAKIQDTLDKMIFELYGII